MKAAIGEIFGSLTLVELLGPSAKGKALFRCACGVEKAIRLGHVKSGATVSCGCAKRSVFVTQGQQSGRLTVINPEYGVVGKVRVALCQCECGKKKLVGVWEIANKATRSCGCLVVEVARRLSLRHGDEGTRLYRIWTGMKNRCYNPNSDNFDRYGGRGISVCAAWKDQYESFRDWAIVSGYSDELQIDRINNDGDYKPSNCRWVPAVVNANNRGNNHLIYAFGEMKTISEWSRDHRCNVSFSALKQRVQKSKMASEDMIALDTSQARKVGYELRKKLRSNMP